LRMAAMNRITKKFQELKKAGKKGLVGYLTAGDPDVKRSMKDIRAAIANGVDVLELGVPFSDPTADGPIIQEASRRALEAGMTVKKALKMVEGIRKESQIPIVLFGYANPFFRYGYEKVCRDAAKAGADGMLIVDLPYEESGELRVFMDRHDLFFIPLVAPTTPRARAAMILKNAKGFVYYIMVTGVTGIRDDVANDVAANLKELRKSTDLPVAVGFGISGGAQARMAAAPADAVVVGSALVKAAREGRLVRLVRELRKALGMVSS
jgi:tryptophan synthase alpha chain